MPDMVAILHPGRLNSRRLILAVLATLLMGLSAGTSRAQDPPQTSVLGIGGRSCGYWIQLRTAGSPSAPDWLAGFLTAYNFWEDPHKNVLAGTDVDGALAAMDNWCREHATSAIAQGAIELVRSLGGRH